MVVDDSPDALVTACWYSIGRRCSAVAASSPLERESATTSSAVVAVPRPTRYPMPTPMIRATTAIATVTHRRREPCMYTAMLFLSPSPNSWRSWSSAGHHYGAGGGRGRGGDMVAHGFRSGRRCQGDDPRRAE